MLKNLQGCKVAIEQRELISLSSGMRSTDNSIFSSSIQIAIYFTLFISERTGKAKGKKVQVAQKPQ